MSKEDAKSGGTLQWRERLRTALVIGVGGSLAAVTVGVGAGMAAPDRSTSNSRATSLESSGASPAQPSHVVAAEAAAGLPPAIPYWYRGILHTQQAQPVAVAATPALVTSGSTTLVGPAGGGVGVWSVVDHGSLRTLPLGNATTVPTLSPDGTRITWVEDLHGSVQVVVYDAVTHKISGCLEVALDLTPVDKPNPPDATDLHAGGLVGNWNTLQPSFALRGIDNQGRVWFDWWHPLRDPAEGSLQVWSVGQGAAQRVMGVPRHFGSPVQITSAGALMVDSESASDGGVTALVGSVDAAGHFLTTRRLRVSPQQWATQQWAGMWAPLQPLYLRSSLRDDGSTQWEVLNVRTGQVIQIPGTVPAGASLRWETDGTVLALSGSIAGRRQQITVFRFKLTTRTWERALHLKGSVLGFAM